MLKTMESTQELGVIEGQVRLVPHSPRWERWFQVEKQVLKQAMASYVKEIRHIGSTAVPGIHAKPIIDIMAGLKEVDAYARVINLLHPLGYRYRGEQEIPGWHFFTKSQKDEIITHHLHVVQWGSRYWYDHLLFLWYLRRHQEVAELYEQLKLELAAKYPDDREAYTRDKTDFIRKVTEMAWKAQRHLANKGETPLPIAHSFHLTD